MTADTITAIKKAEHERIWLEPHPGVELEGRMWCQDNQWGDDGVEYVLASTLESLQRENEESKARIEKLEQTLKSVTGNKIGFTYEPTGERVNLYSPNSSAFAIIAQHPEILQAIVGARADIEGRAALSSTGDTHGN